MENRIKIFIVIIWLFTGSGILGIKSSYSELFLSLTPLYLLVNFLLIILTLKGNTKNVFCAIIIPIFIGFICEVLGVNFGLIFGSYSYGDNLGVKILGVPVIICFNWSLLSIITTDVVKLITTSKLLCVFIGAFLMTLIDFLIEFSAPRFQFWEFENGIVPFWNYLSWFLISIISISAYQYFQIMTNKHVSIHIFACIMFFFSIFFII